IWYLSCSAGELRLRSYVGRTAEVGAERLTFANTSSMSSSPLIWEPPGADPPTPAAAATPHVALADLGAACYHVGVELKVGMTIRTSSPVDLPL
ncbi:MAG: hypothetical protein ACRDZ8_14690, partial [Acidimicrobiales bacterium]